MKTFEFQGHHFKIEEDAKLFLEKYLKRVEQYTQKHHIDEDIIEDMYQNILEKLLVLKEPIQQKKLITIINNLGEPEDIFEGNEQIHLSTEKETKSGWVLGVCSRLAQKTTLPARIFRIVVFGGIFLFTIGFWIYLLLFMIKYTKEGKEQTIAEIAPRIKSFFKGIGRCIQGLCKLIRTIIVELTKGIRKLSTRVFFLIKAFFTTYLRRILSRCIRIGIIIVLVFVIFALCGVVVARFGNLTFQNQSFTMLFNNNIGIPLIILLCVAIFWCITTCSTFSKNPIKNRYLHLCIAIIGIGGGIRLASSCVHFANFQRITLAQETEFSPDNKQAIIEMLIKENGYRNTRIHILPAQSDKFYMKTVVNVVVPNNKYTQLIQDSFIYPHIEQIQNNQYQIGRDEKTIFSQPVPFNKSHIEISIYAPKNAKIRMPNRGCYNGFYRYDNNSDSFICDEQQ